MTSEQFAYWLQGFVELNDGAMPTEAQWKSVQDHLQTVFVKVTPVVGGSADRRGEILTAILSGTHREPMTGATC